MTHRTPLAFPGIVPSGDILVRLFHEIFSLL